VNVAADERSPAVFDAGSDGDRRSSRRHRRRRKTWIALTVVAVLGTAVFIVNQTRPFGIDFAHPLGTRHHAKAASNDGTEGAATSTVSRRTLTARTSVGGTLGYAGAYDVFGRAQGTVTRLPAVGSVVRQGEVLYQVDGAPVLLLYGSTPAYRTLAGGASASDVTGQDVRQLNAALVALGYADGLGLDASSNQFGWATRVAVQRLQKHLGVAQTGALTLGQIVFLPTAARIITVAAQLGGSAGGPILSATSTARVVKVSLDAAQQSQVKVADAVTVTLPNGQSTPGRIAAVGKVATTGAGGGAGASTTPKITVTVTPTRPAATGTLDQAPVQVAITTATVPDVLVVPVTALLALVGGGYAVEEVAADGTHHLVPVTLGLFDDAEGLVQVTGPALAAGQRVVVPAS
jgi:hypothetical protein